MGGLFGSQPKVIPEFTGLQVNTSVQVLPVPIIYGSPRVAINLIYYNGFNSQLVKQQAGKGILTGGKGGAQQVEYFATVIMAIGEGILGDVKILYQDQNVWTPADFPSNGAFYFNGTDVQAPWSYVVSNWPVDARSYKDTAYYGFSNGQLDASATVPQINLVLHGLLQGTCPLNNTTIEITTGQYDPNGNPISFIGGIPCGDMDADPAAVIYDFLTNSRYGATFPAQFIDTTTLFTSPSGYNPLVGDTALSTYCQAVGFGYSVVLNNVETASSILERWCKNLVVAPVWNGELLSFVPYWSQPISSNPGWDSGNGIGKKYFSPCPTAVVTIPLDQILQSDAKEDDPIAFMRKDPIEVYNTIRVDFKDRTNFFNDVPAEAKDEAHIELFGPRTDNIGLADEFSLGSYANISAVLQLRRNIGIVRTYTWRMSALWGFISPMEIYNIPDPVNYNNIIAVRIVSVEDDADEIVTITAEEFPFGTAAASVLPLSQSTPPNQGPVNVPPSPAYPPVMFAPTTDMLTATGFATPQWIFGDSGGNDVTFAGALDPNWGGCNIWISLDDVSYQLLGTLDGPSTIGLTTTPLPGYVGANPDMTDTLTVNLNECDGVLSSVSPTAAAAGHSICVVRDASGFEIFGYTTATLVAPFTYQLSGLYRNLYGTISRLFNASSQFLYVGSLANIFETALPPAYVGQTFWVKPQSFNTLHNSAEDLSTVVAYEYVATSPTPPGPIGYGNNYGNNYGEGYAAGYGNNYGGAYGE